MKSIFHNPRVPSSCRLLQYLPFFMVVAVTATALVLPQIVVAFSVAPHTLYSENSIAYQHVASALAPASDVPQAPLDDSSRIAAIFDHHSLPFALISFYGLGILLSLTPCVLPMAPILSGIIVGGSSVVSRSRSFMLSVSYVLGMAFVYAVAGVFAAMSGTMLSTMLQNVWVLGSFSLLFIILALSMFGYFELQLPSTWQTRISALSHNRGGSLVGSAVMGGISSLVVSPCVAAPLAGALLYIAKTGNIVLGGAALFCLALGMGAPLVLMGIAADLLLPRVGAWMELVKKGFGILLLGVAVWLLQPVAPEGTVTVAWAALLAGGGIWLFRELARTELRPVAKRLWRSVAVLAVISGFSLFGYLFANQDGLGAYTTSQATALTFEPVESLKELEDKVFGNRTTVMLFITADWCSWCAKMKGTLQEPAVRNQLNGMRCLTADISDATREHKKILRRFGIYGPPGIVFLQGQNGKMHVLKSVMGYQKPGPFVRIVKAVSRQQSAGILQDRGQRL